MDWLEEELGEDAVVAFGEALPEHMYLVPDDMETVMKILNQVLKDLGSKLTLLETLAMMTMAIHGELKIMGHLSLI